MILYASLGENFQNWLRSSFVWFYNQLLNLFHVVITYIYNIFIEVSAFFFDQLVKLICYVISFFPAYDLSKADAALTKIIGYWAQFDKLLPLSEALVCASILMAYWLCFTVIRLCLKLIPGIG